MTIITLGNRGVVTLPRDWIYHDNFTLAASRGAARYGVILVKRILIQVVTDLQFSRSTRRMKRRFWCNKGGLEGVR